MITRICKICAQDKPFNPSAKSGTRLNGFHGHKCWDCHVTHSTALHRRLILDGQGRQRTAGHVTAALWAKRNRGACNAALRKYTMSKIQRIPPWANLEHIATFYQVASALNLSVDHIIPLHGKTVSGLHVLENLDLISRVENSSKGNRWNWDTQSHD